MHPSSSNKISSPGAQLAGNVLFVDAVFGNDVTAEPFNGNRPYASIKAALKKVHCLNLDQVLEIFIRPGTYSEGKLKLVDNVSVRGSGRLSTVVYGSIDTSEVKGRSSTLLEFSLVSTEEPAVFGGSSGFVSFRMMRVESNYFSKRDDQSTVVISPNLPTPLIPCIRSGNQCQRSHVITDSEVILNSTGGADLKVFNHLDGSLELERNTHQLNADTFPIVSVTSSPFTPKQDNTEYWVQQDTEFILPVKFNNNGQVVPALKYITVRQNAGTTNFRSERSGDTLLLIFGRRQLFAGQTAAILPNMNLNVVPSFAIFPGPNVPPTIPTNLRVYSVGGAERKQPQTQTFRGLNNRSLIQSNNQLFETANLKLDNVPQPTLPTVPITSSPYTVNQNRVQYVVTAGNAGDNNFIILPNPLVITGGQVIIQILSQTDASTFLTSTLPIQGPLEINRGQTIIVNFSPEGTPTYYTSILNSADGAITAKQVGESHALNVPRVQILNSNRLINTPGINGFELQKPAGGGNLVFRIGPPANDTFVALHLFVPQNAVGSIVQATGNTFFDSNIVGTFATNPAQTEGQFQKAGLYYISDALSLRSWTVGYLGFPNALTRVNDSAPELPPQISINTPTLETGTIETLVTSESTTASIHINQVAVFERRTVPAINHPREAKPLVSVQQVSTQYEHLRGGSQIESTSEQLEIGQRIDNIASLNLHTIILGGSNTLILPDIVPYNVPPQEGQVLGGTQYLILQGKAVVGSSSILSTPNNRIVISGQSVVLNSLILLSTQNVELVATYPSQPADGANGFWVASITTISP